MKDLFGLERGVNWHLTPNTGCKEKFHATPRRKWPTEKDFFFSPLEPLNLHRLVLEEARRRISIEVRWLDFVNRYTKFYEWRLKRDIRQRKTELKEKLAQLETMRRFPERDYVLYSQEFWSEYVQNPKTKEEQRARRNQEDALDTFIHGSRRPPGRLFLYTQSTYKQNGPVRGRSV